jgi:hypothetical protein
LSEKTTNEFFQESVSEAIYGRHLVCARLNIITMNFMAFGCHEV